MDNTIEIKTTALIDMVLNALWVSWDDGVPFNYGNRNYYAEFKDTYNNYLNDLRSADYGSNGQQLYSILKDYNVDEWIELNDFFHDLS